MLEGYLWPLRVYILVQCGELTRYGLVCLFVCLAGYITVMHTRLLLSYVIIELTRLLLARFVCSGTICHANLPLPHSASLLPFLSVSLSSLYLSLSPPLFRSLLRLRLFSQPVNLLLA